MGVQRWYSKKMDTHKLSLHICNSIKQYIIDLELVSQTVRIRNEKRNNRRTRLALKLGLQAKLKIVTLLVLLMSQNSNCNGFGSRNSMLRTRVIGTRYGKLQGVILPMDQHKFLKPVEAYLGVPYATPPTASNRYVLNFMVSKIHLIKQLAWFRCAGKVEMSILRINSIERKTSSKLIYFRKWV